MLSKETENEIIKLFKEGISFTQIQKLTGINRKKVSRLLVSKGLYTKKKANITNVKYKKDESVFEKIDTEEKAYWLGFLYADGYIDTTYGKVRIALKESDINHLKKFRKFMKSDAPIKQRIENWAYQFEISSMKIAKDLEKLGCFQCKSLSLKFPSKEQVPEYLIHHFIRGYFDGDGSITVILPNVNERNYFLQPSIRIIGTPDILDNIEKYFLEILNRNKPNKRIHSKQWNENTQAISYSGNKQVLKIFNYLYENATVFLTRKLLRFNQFGMYLPPQEEAIKLLESITAELSEEAVKFDDLESLNRQFESEGVQDELVDGDINDDSNIDQAQRVGSDPLPYE